jgi:hypothetical protein
LEEEMNGGKKHDLHCGRHPVSIRKAVAQGSTLDGQEVCAGVIIIRIVAASTFANILTSSLVSSVISGGLFYWLTARKERNQFLRGKLE